MPGQLARRHRGRFGQRVRGSAQQLDRLVEHPLGLEVLGQRDDRAERRIDRAVAERGGRGVEERRDLQRDVRVRLVESAQQRGRAQPPPDHVDPERPGAHRRERSQLGRQQLAGVRQERLAVPGEHGSAGGAGEQPYPERLLQRGDALRNGLLRDRQIGGGVLEPARLHGGDEGAHGVEVHDDRL
jgi:hypothetical protein